MKPPGLIGNPLDRKPLLAGQHMGRPTFCQRFHHVIGQLCGRCLRKNCHINVDFNSAHK